MKAPPPNNRTPNHSRSNNAQPRNFRAVCASPALAVAAFFHTACQNSKDPQRRKHNVNLQLLAAGRVDRPPATKQHNIAWQYQADIHIGMRKPPMRTTNTPRGEPDIICKAGLLPGPSLHPGLHVFVALHCSNRPQTCTCHAP